MTIGDRLLAAGYQVESAETGEKALSLAGLAPGKGIINPDLVILDIMLPGIDGFEVCRHLRQRGFTMPILMLTAKGAVGDRVKGLKTGADDYLCKPFAMQELMARVEAQLRRAAQGASDQAGAHASSGGPNATPGPERPSEPPAGATPGPTHAGKTPAAASIASPSSPGSGPAPAATQRFGDWLFDQAGRSLQRLSDPGQAPIQLSTTEFRLLSVLVGNPGRVMSREELLDAAWGYNNETTSRTVDVHIAWLRAKLAETDQPRHLQTVRRAGYKFVP
jgi:DNA-binding response OmpR family regulator